MKLFFVSAVAIVLFLLFGENTYSQEEFIVSAETIYEVDKHGVSRVIHEIFIENAFTTVYTQKYSLKLSGVSPRDIRAFNDERELEFEFIQGGNNSEIKVSFPDHVVGLGRQRHFFVSYSDSTLARKTGDVWEVFVPKIDISSFDRYEVELVVPRELGIEAFVSPKSKTTSIGGEKTSYFFDKEGVAPAGVTAAFGEFQVYSFKLNYHIQNFENKRVTQTIALPPDTAFQKIIFENIEPLPVDVEVDNDGNWIAQYELDRGEKLDIKLNGAVQIFAVPRPFSNPTAEILQKNLAPTKHWQTEHPTISSLATINSTPRQIYDYVSGGFTYNYERVRPDAERLGALAAISTPEAAICMEFTDAFVAIARAAGIPAREVNGFAYTQNPELQPLSLVADVLHAWPEYWDESRQTFVPVDPTWGNTTGGIDYFSKLDLRHITFVNHGEDSEAPYPAGSYKLGENPQKDVFVEVAELPEAREERAVIEIDRLSAVALASLKYRATIRNNGPVAIYNRIAEIKFDGRGVDSVDIAALPPFGKTEIEFSVPFGLLGGRSPGTLSVAFGEDEGEVFINKERGVITHLAVLLFAVLVGVGATFFLWLNLRQIKNQ